MIEGYTTVSKIAEKWEVSERTVQILCAEGRIDGVTKFGRSWAIPIDASNPTDSRLKSGNYRNWRKKTNDS